MSNDEVTIINDNVLTEVISVNIVEEEIIQVNPIEDSHILVEATESEPVTVIDDLKEIPVFTVVQGIPVEQKGVPNGVATLDENGKVPLEQIPDLNIDTEDIKNDVRQWIDDSVANKPDSSEVQQWIGDATSGKADSTVVNEQLDSKLDKSDFHQHFRGVYTSYAALNNITNPIAGNYAHVDAGVGSPTDTYAYDVNDSIWRKQTSSGIPVLSTDSIPEGNSNLFFTKQRVSNVVDPLLQPINQNIQTINNQLAGIDVLLSEILGV